MCLEPFPLAELRADLVAIEAAFWRLDVVTYQERALVVRGALPCVDGVMTPPDTGALHRFMAFEAVVRGDTDAERGAFAAARVADPGWALPSNADPGVVDVWAHAPADPSRGAIPAPSRRVVDHFDGVAATDRPAALPTVHQEVAGARVLSTTYLWSSDPFPPRAEPPPAPGPLPRHPLGWVTVELALGAGASAVVAVATATTYRNAPPSAGQLDGAYALNHAAVVGTAGMGSAAVLTGFAALATGRW